MKIGITLDMSVAFWANGMQQNIVFLYSLLKKAGNECFYISHSKPAHVLDKDHQGMMLNDLLGDADEILDVLIVAGFDLLPEMYDKLLKRNPDLKIILVHFGNKLMDDIHYGICSSNEKKVPLDKPKYLSQVWISPHHAFAEEYIKAYYNISNVHVAPYIWDSFFVESKIKELSAKKLSPQFRKDDVNKICIFEPNISHLKNCIIPLAICEKFNQMFPGELDSINTFSCERIREKKFFQKLMHKFTIVDETSKCFFNNRWGSLDALSKFGNTVVSHQMYNELNYSHFEVLYLGLPLIHNSPRLENLGYYYPDFDVTMGAKQLKAAIENHESTKDQYKKDAINFLRKYKPCDESNIKNYMRLLQDG